MKHVLSLLGIALIAACSQHNVTTNTTKPGPTQVFLIDAPFPYDQVARVDVYIVRVAAGTSADTTDGAPGVIAAPHRAYTCSRSETGRLRSWARASCSRANTCSFSSPWTPTRRASP